VLPRALYREVVVGQKNAAEGPGTEITMP